MPSVTASQQMESIQPAGGSALEAQYAEFMDSAVIRRFLKSGGQVNIAVENRPAASIAELMSLGHRRFSEKFAQEVAAKWNAEPLKGRPARLNFFGALQRNKARFVLQNCDAIESIDSRRLALRLFEMKREPHRADEYSIQVNISREPQKRGVAPEEAEALHRCCTEELGLPIAGLMAIPQKGPEAAASFAALRALADRLGLEGCIMGMSDDYAQAIAAGSTQIRVARVIFKEIRG